MRGWCGGKRRIAEGEKRKEQVKRWGGEQVRKWCREKKKQSRTRRTRRDAEEETKRVRLVRGLRRDRASWVGCARVETRGSEARGGWCWVLSGGCRGRKRQSRTQRTRRDAEEEKMKGVWWVVRTRCAGALWGG